MPTGPMMLGSSVDFDVPAEIAFDYLVEPRNRPQWQSSLKSVDVLDEGPPRAGLRWVDVTRPGMRPRMRITAMERPEMWGEAGEWRGITANLMLLFEPSDHGCAVSAIFRAHGRGLWRPIGPPITLAAAVAVRQDLRRASRILSARAAGH